MSSRIFTEFEKIAAAHPRHTALSYKQNNQHQLISYSRLNEQAVRLGNLLIARGIKKDDHAAILLGNQPEWPIAFLALRYAQAVVIPLDTHLSLSDIQLRLTHSEATALFFSHSAHPALKEHLDKTIPGLQTFIVDSEEFSLQLKNSPDRAQEKTAPAEPEADTAAAIFYSSGTTSTPKGIILSENNLLSNASAIMELKLPRPNDNYISMLPLHHTYSFMVTCLLPLLTGSRISYPANLNPEELVGCLRDTRVTIFAGVPQVFSLIHHNVRLKLSQIPFGIKHIITALVETCWFIRKCTGINLSKLVLGKLHKSFGGNIRMIISGGARLDPGIALDFFKWGFTLLEGYGLTETSPIVALNPFKKPKIGSVGKPLPHVQVKIAVPDQKGRGEVVIQGPNVMQGYYKMPDETKKAVRDGWFSSGDLGSIDRQGYLFIHGRKDEIIVLSSGKNINPEEIEKYFTGSPMVKETCVFALRKDALLESDLKLIGVIVVNTEYFGNMALPDIEKEVRTELEHLSRQLPMYMRLKGVVITQEKLPRTRLGKMMRYKIEELYAGKITGLTDHADAGQLSAADTGLLASEVTRRILQHLSTRLKREVHLKDHLEFDLGLDSLERMELLLEIQELFKITIPDSVAMEFLELDTVKDLIVKAQPFLPPHEKAS